MKIRKHLLIGLCNLAFFAGCRSIPNEMQIVRKSKNIFAPRYFNLEEAVGANKLLINFPDKIPGAKSIDKYLIPEAKYCLVHIRQAHLTKRQSKKELKEVKEVQNNIYAILLHLVENYKIDRVYDEGLTPDFAKIKNLCAGVGHMLNRDFEKLKEESQSLYENCSEFQNHIEYDAVYRIASEIGKLEIAAADDSNALKEAEYMYNRLKGMGFFRWFTERKRSFNAIHENREDKFLEMASEQEEPILTVIYGADHAWGGKASCGELYKNWGRESICDNIAKWNFDNPDKKFSLIEIAPFGI